jgi:FAD-binding domain
MYMFINVPAISVMEWHPFSASLRSHLNCCLQTLLRPPVRVAEMLYRIPSQCLQMHNGVCKLPAAITSAPGDPYVSVHIRDAGDWTHELYEHMSQYAMNVEVSVLQLRPHGLPWTEESTKAGLHLPRLEMAQMSLKRKLSCI